MTSKRNQQQFIVKIYVLSRITYTVYVREIGRYVWPPPPPPNYFSPLFFVSNPSSNYLTTLYTIRILSGHCLHSCVYMYPTAQFRLLVIPINSCHKAKIVTKWFQERPHIILIKWPGNSPDLNPIENVCIWMKSSWGSRTRPASPCWKRRSGNSERRRCGFWILGGAGQENAQENGGCDWKRWWNELSTKTMIL